MRWLQRHGWVFAVVVSIEYIPVFTTRGQTGSVGDQRGMKMVDELFVRKVGVWITTQVKFMYQIQIIVVELLEPF